MPKNQIVKKYKLTIVKYNFGEKFLSTYIELDKYPIESEINKYLEHFNEKNLKYKSFETTIHIEEFFKVI